MLTKVRMFVMVDMSVSHVWRPSTCARVSVMLDPSQDRALDGYTAECRSWVVQAGHVPNFKPTLESCHCLGPGMLLDVRVTRGANKYE